jgi:UDP-N-acetylmuramoyl-L-alanyl-D-glutamate--2,6-diaminopimelate ligase
MPKYIDDILTGISDYRISGDRKKEIGSIQFDSRLVKKGDVFVAVKGTQVDGHQFIQLAVEKGASVIVCEKLPSVLNDEITYVQLPDSAKSLGILASNYFNRPSSKLKLLGVTGTNGKTTIATLLYQLFGHLGYKPGLISTVANYIGNKKEISTHTTPDALSINRLLADMAEAGCDYIFMEVSSHAIVQERISGLTFTGGIFTNITHDHLDYHKTFRDYLNAKKMFFDRLPDNSFAVFNSDDKNGKVMAQNTKATKYFYGLKSMADFKARIIESHFDGMLIHIDGKELWTTLIGEFNVYNLLAIYAGAVLLGQDKDKVLQKISILRTVDGRFEYLRSNDGITAIVDYAHTPDALLNVLTTINKIRSGNEKLITVVGAGGNRDKSKRPIMARVAVENSTQLILTSDNPRNEDPETILEDMKKGIEADQKKKVLVITDRKEAIKTACMLAQNGDIILVAGKGHETYQEIKGIKHHFSDKEIIAEHFMLNHMNLQ